MSDTKELNKKLKELVFNFLDENELKCETCSSFKNGKCKSVVYCVVGRTGVGMYIAYRDRSKA